MNQNDITQVTNHWRSVWRGSHYARASGGLGRFFRKLLVRCGGLSDNRFVLKAIIHKEIPELKGLRILDAGAGTGLNSIAAARQEARVTLMDIAPEALAIARKYYEEQDLSADYVEGSIFEMPFADETFDVVWNTGVLEHFQEDTRKVAVAEMFRVLKKGGTILTLNPNFNAPVYRAMKERADLRGEWQAGVEYPLQTLRDVAPSNCMITEYSRGLLMQFHFCKYLFPRSLRPAWIVFHELFSCLTNPLNYLPGYLLVTVIKKP